MKIENVRNFSIIAHIDHGKSTLADRILLNTGSMSQRGFRAQVLDDMDLERERGITIKASAVTIAYKGRTLNFIDTPGHVDFSSEVIRSLLAVEGAILLVDATQGVQAQTVANFYLAMERNLTVIPVINKIDLPTARASEVAEEIRGTLDLTEMDPLEISAKEGKGVEAVLDAIVARIPPPEGEPEGKVRALIFDAVYDDYRGVVVYVRVFDGSLSKGDRIKLLGVGTEHEVVDVGTFSPAMTPCKTLLCGHVGYFVANIKNLKDIQVGDTVATDGAVPLHTFKPQRPMVFCSLFPSDNQAYTALRVALEKLSLNDAAFTFTPETTSAMGFGFRCGFLGLLHMDVVQERLERESGIDLVQTAPSVTYQAQLVDGSLMEIQSPADMPDVNRVTCMKEPIVRVSLIVPAEYIGTVMKLALDARGTYISTEYLSQKKVILTYRIPFAEVVFNFFDRLKSMTRGFGTMDYDFVGYEEAPLVRLDILVNGDPAEPLSRILHKSKADVLGRRILKRLKDEIHQHLFQIPLQAAIGGRIIARENISALSKNVTAKCYGGDVTRKRKLWEKQKEGKKRMKSIGRVEIPQDAFLSVLKAEEDD